MLFIVNHVEGAYAKPIKTFLEVPYKSVSGSQVNIIIFIQGAVVLSILRN